MIRYFLVVSLCLTGAAGTTVVGQNSTSGSSAPDTTFQNYHVKDLHGKAQKLQDLPDGGVVLLTFFPRCFTGTCAAQLKSLRDNYPNLKKANIEVWAVSTDPADGPHGQRAYAKFLKLPFPLIPDVDRKISLAFGAVQSKEQMAARMSVMISKEGKVLWVDKQINPSTHGADVLARYKAEVDPEPGKKDEVKADEASTPQKEPAAQP